MKLLERLNAWLTPRSIVAAPELTATYPLGSIAGEIEEVSWHSLLDDIDRFASTFRSDTAR